jgi:hypothetical protein
MSGLDVVVNIFPWPTSGWGDGGQAHGAFCLFWASRSVSFCLFLSLFSGAAKRDRKRQEQTKREREKRQDAPWAALRVPQAQVVLL